jgi:hypothetical protein
MVGMEPAGAKPGGGVAEQAGAEASTADAEHPGANPGRVDAEQAEAAPGGVVVGHTRAAPSIVDAKHAGAKPSTVDAERTGAALGGAVAEHAGAALGGVAGHAGAAPSIDDAEHAGAEPGRVDAEHAGAAHIVGTQPAGAKHGQVVAGPTRTTPSTVDAKLTTPTPSAIDTKHAAATPSTVNAEHTAPTPSTVDAELAPAALSVVDAVILERAAGALRLVLDRTRGRAPADDPALVETLLDATAPEQARLHAARRLGLDPTALARAVAPLNDRPRVISAGTEGAPHGGPGVAESSLAAGWSRTAPARAAAADGPRLSGTADTDSTAVAPHGRATADRQGIRTSAATLPRGSDAAQSATGQTTPRAWTSRLGVGPAVPVLELPRSWAAARTALRFTAEGTPQDPGPRIVYADELGGIALLADLVVPGAEPPPDVRALETAAATTPWLPATLHAVASTASLRAAAAGINVHHSTLQDRLTHAEHLLGWPVRTPQGRLRLQLALAMRHLARP